MLLLKKNGEKKDHNQIKNFDKLKFPAGILKYILFQRTTYMGNSKLYKFLSYLGASKKIGNITHKPTVYLKGLLFNNKIKDSYTNDMYGEYLKLKDYLPQDCSNILDIGCGVAGVDIFISRHYKNNININLLDKSTIDKKVYYNFKDKTSFYSSLNLAKKFLKINNVPEEKIFLHEVSNDNKLKMNTKLDLVLSLISWGYHYPVSTYLDEVYENLEKNGICILDVRKNTNGKDLLLSKFNNAKVVEESLSWERVLCVKN